MALGHSEKGIAEIRAGAVPKLLQLKGVGMSLILRALCKVRYVVERTGVFRVCKHLQHVLDLKTPGKSASSGVPPGPANSSS